MSSQSLRKSQYVYVYGPGGILESVRGPRLVYRADIGLFGRNGIDPSRFEIQDLRITQGLMGDGARVFWLPSNAELEQPEFAPVYGTKPFPVWRLCLNEVQHGTSSHGSFSVLYSGRSCPQCGSWRAEPIRFVRACRLGHLDDVNWNEIVHGGHAAHSVRWFRWLGGGGSLSSVNLECSRCTSHVNFGQVYSMSLTCSGRYPEREPIQSQGLEYPCTETAHVIQRQASNLRIPELMTLFSIPYYSYLHRQLQTREVIAALRVSRGGINSIDDFRALLETLRSGSLITQALYDGILQHSWDEIRTALQVVLTQPLSTRYEELIDSEFGILLQGSLHGIPHQTLANTTSRVIFEMNPNDAVLVSTPGRRVLRVSPVRRLSTITILRGYRREVDTQPAELVDISFTNGNDRWFPGHEFLGEGILVTLQDNDGWMASSGGEEANTWREAYGNSTAYPDYVFRGDSRIELHPAFVWWHTLSHLMIRALSVESGYSSASIRERVYLQRNGDSFRGGVLVYATQPGSEGTMGGLISLATRYNDILRFVFEYLETCSGDPLCIENRFQNGQYNGAACYGCLLLSETSCEHRNMWLDRSVLRDNQV